MTTDILRLECDNLVIGSGLAGLTAALRLRGKTVVATAGLGATAISSGVLAFPQGTGHRGRAMAVEDLN